MNIKLLGVSAIWNNINGTAIKYDDGTMICYKYGKRHEGLSWSSENQVKISTIKDAWIFPDQFIEPPTIFAETNEGNCTSYRSIRDKNKVSEQTLLCITSSTTNYATLSYFAIGKWK